MAATIRNIMQQSITVGGKVADANNGVIQLFTPLHGVESLRSANAGKFPVGQVVEVTLRDEGKKKTITRIVPIDATGSFALNLSAASTTADVVAMVATIGNVMLARNLPTLHPGELSKKLKAAVKEQKPVAVMPMLDYVTCDLLRSQLNELAKDDAYFTVTQVSVEELEAAGVKVSGSLQQLEYVAGHWVPDAMRPIFGVAARVSAFGAHLNLLLTGPSGFGKTSTAQALAKWLGYDCLRVNCAAISDVTGWFGEYEAKAGTTHFNPTRFTELIQRGNCVVILDEVNRLEPWLTNPLFGILDHDRATEVHNTEIKVGPGVIFVMTVNVGAMYAGTFVTDAAFLNRVDATIELGAPPDKVEKLLLLDALKPLAERHHSELTPLDVVDMQVPQVDELTIGNVVNLLNKLRGVVERERYNVDVSTRTGLKVVNLLRLGLTIHQAVEYTIVNAAAQEERKSLVDQVQSLLGVPTSSSDWLNPNVWGSGKP